MPLMNLGSSSRGRVKGKEKRLKFLALIIFVVHFIDDNALIRIGERILIFRWVRLYGLKIWDIEGSWDRYH